MEYLWLKPHSHWALSHRADTLSHRADALSHRADVWNDGIGRRLSALCECGLTMTDVNDLKIVGYKEFSQTHSSLQVVNVYRYYGKPLAVRM